MTENTVWRVSSYSGNNNDCVEVAVGALQTRVRDSKARDAGELVFNADQFEAFAEEIKRGRLGR